MAIDSNLSISSGFARQNFLVNSNNTKPSPNQPETKKANQTEEILIDQPKNNNNIDSVEISSAEESVDVILSDTGQKANYNPEGILNQTQKRSETGVQRIESRRSELNQLDDIGANNRGPAQKSVNQAPGPVINAGPSNAAQIGGRLDTSI